MNIRSQIHTVVKWEEVPWQIKRAIDNGCGGKGGLVKPPHAVFFRTSCGHHDYGFWKGGTEKDRLACDKMLRQMMQDDVKKVSFWKQVRYRPWCALYYQAVRFGGKKYFRFSNNKRYPDLEYYEDNPDKLKELEKIVDRRVI